MGRRSFFVFLSVFVFGALFFPLPGTEARLSFSEKMTPADVTSLKVEEDVEDTEFSSEAARILQQTGTTPEPNWIDSSSWMVPSEGAFLVIPAISYFAWSSDNQLSLRDYSRYVDINGTGMFTLEKVGQSYTFTEVQTGKCLDVSGRSSGAQAILLDCSSSLPSQLWKAGSVRSYDNSVQWRNSATGLCLDAVDGARNSPLLMMRCRRQDSYGVATQLWLTLPPSAAVRESSPSGLSLRASSRTPRTCLNTFSRHASWKPYLPTSVDLRGLLPSPKDQGSCGSCSVFGAVASVEGAYNVLSGTVPPLSLSEEQVLDCFGSCTGGWPADVYHWMASWGPGVAATDRYGPYTGSPGACRNIPGVARVRRYEEVPAYDVAALKAAVSRQPVISYITLTEELTLWTSWQIFRDSRGDCLSGAMLTHVLTVVGYGTENGEAYWIVRNSFGPEWGSGGYGRILQGVCGMGSLPSMYPVLADPSGNPCGALNPCGAGNCTLSSSPSTPSSRSSSPSLPSYECSCPPKYAVATNTDGTETCAIVDICGSSPSNPCSAGTCVNNGNGDYHCVCFYGYVSAFSSVGRPICIPPQSTSQKSQNYTVQENDDCYLISTAFGLTVNNLISMNPRTGRNVCSPLVVGDVLNVTNVTPYNCSVLYGIQPSDTCASIESKFNLLLNTLNSGLNPGLNCSENGLISGQEICIKSGVPNKYKMCILADSVGEADVANKSCDVIMERNKQISLFDFYEMNRGINCGNLFLGQQVCVAIQALPPGTCSPYYVWQSGDTCSSVIGDFCGTRSGKTWSQCFGSSVELCVGTGSSWSPGKILCLSSCLNYQGLRVPYCYG